MKCIFSSDLNVSLISAMGNDLSVSTAAKVSTIGGLAAEDVKTEAKFGLINFLMKHRHGTPFEHNSMTFLIKAPIFVYREFHRHRVGWSYNEESGRYKTLEPEFYIPPPDRPMMKVDGWKPGRPKFDPIPDGENGMPYHNLLMRLQDSYDYAYRQYAVNLDCGFDPGLARACLPVAIYSSMFATCNARSMMHFLSLRTYEPEAKFVSYPLWEIDQVARKLESIFATLFPLTHKAFCENGRVAP